MRTENTLQHKSPYKTQDTEPESNHVRPPKMSARNYKSLAEKKKKNILVEP